MTTSPPDTAKASAVDTVEGRLRLVFARVRTFVVSLPDAVIEDHADLIDGISEAIESLSEDEMERLRAATPVPTGEAEGREVERAEWRCEKCSCRTYARIEERRGHQLYGPSEYIRCVNCKEIFHHPQTDIAPLSPAPRQTSAPTQVTVDLVARAIFDDEDKPEDEWTRHKGRYQGYARAALSALPAQGEPVAWIPAADLNILETEPCATARVFNRVDSGYFWKPLYASPPQPDAERIEAEEKFLAEYKRMQAGEPVTYFDKSSRELAEVLRKGEQS